MTIAEYADEKKRLEESLRESREHLDDAVVELKQAAMETLATPAAAIVRHRYACLLGAFAIGLFLGTRAAVKGERIL